MNDNYENLLNNIAEPMVCETCLKEYGALQNPDITLRDYVKVDVGFSQIGIQVWCQRHDKNICHIDFEGNRHGQISEAWKRSKNAKIYL